MDSLSDEQRSVLDEFALITNVSLDDQERANKSVILLQNHSFNLNNAVLSYFENGLDNVVRNPTPEVVPTPEELFASGAERFESTAVHRNLHDEFVMDSFLPKLPKAPKISNHWQFDLGIHMSRSAFRASEKESEINSSSTQVSSQRRPNFLWIILLIIPKALSMLYSFIRYLFGINTSSMYKALPSLFDYENYEESYNIVKETDGVNAEELHIKTNDFNNLHEASQRDFRFLTVVLVDDSSVGFAKQFLQSPNLKLLLEECSENDFYVANISKSPEALELAHTYKVRRVPYVMLVGNVTRNPQVMSSMSVIYKSNLVYDKESGDPQLANKVIRNLKKSVNHYNPQLVSKRYDKQEMELSRLLKEQQDEAYLKTLAQDREKKQEKQRKLEEEEQKRKLEKVRQGFIFSLIENNWFETQLKDLTAKEVVRVSIKIPDGRRMIQKFPKTMSMLAMYLFVETQLFESKENAEYEQCDTTVEEFCEKFTFNFELFKPLPKVVVPAEKLTIEEFQEIKLGDNILVEYLLDNETDEEEES